MICLPAQMPLLRVGDQELATYESQWVLSSIQEAAERAGHEKWWFAEDVTRSLFRYLKERFSGTTITLAEVTAKIKGTLNAIGFADIAEALSISPPPVVIDLNRLAADAGSGYELAFFQQLFVRIEKLGDLGADQLSFTDLRKCVKALTGAIKWRQDCKVLEQEIIIFIRFHIEKRAHLSRMNLVVS